MLHWNIYGSIVALRLSKVVIVFSAALPIVQSRSKNGFQRKK